MNLLNLKMKSLSQIALVLALSHLALTSEPSLANTSCGDLEFKYVENQDPGFRFVPGNKVYYKGGYFDGAPRYEEVYLVLRKQNLSDLKRIAEVLAYGQGGVSSESILRRLENKVAKSSRSEVRVPLSTLLNGKTSMLTNSRASCEGPNCYNATLQWYKPKTEIKESTAGEIIDYVRENFEKLEEGSELHFGDLIMIGEYGKLSHTAIYLNDNLIWHKGSTQMSSPYTFETFNSAISAYTSRWAEAGAVTFFAYRKKGGVEVSQPEPSVQRRPKPRQKRVRDSEVIPIMNLFNQFEGFIYSEQFSRLEREILSFERDSNQTDIFESSVTGQRIKADDLFSITRALSNKLFPPENGKTEWEGEELTISPSRYRSLQQALRRKNAEADS